MVIVTIDDHDVSAMEKADVAALIRDLPDDQECAIELQIARASAENHAFIKDRQRP